MGKREKEHRKKVLARNTRISNEKEKIQKKQREFLMELIKKEKERGAFENTPSVDQINDLLIEGPTI